MGTNEKASRLSAGVVVSLVLFAVGRVASVYSQLPRRMASHFGASGAADGYMSRDGFLLFMLAVCGGVALLVFALPALIREMPGAINLPNRDYWLAPERQAATIRRISVWLRWFALPVTAFLVLAVELTLRANLDHTGLDMTAFGAGLALYLVANVVLLIALLKGFRVPPAASAGGRAT